MPPAENPGVLLGIVLGVLARRGRDKVTLAASPGIAGLGVWLEQLLAESTGKLGKGLIPVDREPLGMRAVYADDRLFVYVRLTAAAARRPPGSARARAPGAARASWERREGRAGAAAPGHRGVTRRGR